MVPKSPPGPGLRQQKRLDTREALFRSASQLVLRDGFRETTIDAIAAGAGVSRRTFFRYFASKEAAFYGNHESRLELFEERLSAEVQGEDTWCSVRRACLAASQYFLDEREFALRQYELATQSMRLRAYDLSFDERWESVIAQALVDERGADPWPEVEARLAAGAVLGMLRASLRAWLESGGELDLLELRRVAFERLERGLRR